MTFSRMNCPRLSTFAALAVLTGGHALAQDVEPLPSQTTVEQERVASVETETPELATKISGVVGVDLYSHFVSYGLDVWAEGEAFSGSETFNPYAEVALDFDTFTVATGIWGDLNDNAPGGSEIGGDIQEIDWYVGISTSLDKFSIGVTYQAWMFAGGTEQILDISLGYDDSELWGDSGFSLGPSLTIHNRLDTDPEQGLGDDGTILVAAVEVPLAPFVDLPDPNLSLSVPLALGIVLTDDYFIEGGDTGVGFFSGGLSIGYGLGDLIGPEYGDWSLNAGITVYVTEEDIYDNPDDTFVVYNVGVSVAF